MIAVRHLCSAGALFGLVLVPVVASAAMPTAAHAVVYAVDINGVPVSNGALMLRSAGDDLFASIDDLRAWRMVVPAGTPTFMRDGRRYVALRTLTGTRVSFAPATQTVSLVVAPGALQSTDLELSSYIRPLVARPAGAFANYAFAATGGAGINAVAGEVNAGIAAFGGVMRSDFTWTPGLLSRAQTAWQFDDARRMQSFVVGDTITADSKTSSPVRFAGVRWATDFGEQPLFATYPSYAVRGSASVPSALDVYVNDVLALRREVPAGPYTLRDLPLFDGAGTIAVRPAQGAGGISELRVPYYVSRALLRPGLASFSYGAGVLDEGGHAGPVVIDAARRWGINDRFTAGGSAQYAGGRTIVGGTADWLAGNRGVISFAAAASAGSAAAGALWDGGYDYTGRDITAGADVKIASAAFRSLDPTAIAVGREINVHGGLRLARATLAQASFVRDTTFAGPVSVWTLGIASSIRGIPYSLTAYRSTGGGADAFGITSVWSIPLGSGATVSSRVGAGSDSARSQLEFSGSSHSGGTNLNWDVASGMSGASTSAARISAATRFAELDLDATAGNGANTYTTRVAGSVATVGGSIAATRQITGAFALVEVPGIAGVDVYVNSRYAGKTDRRGRLVTSDLVPFVENEIRIDPAHSELSLTFDSVERTIVPPATSGTTIVFSASRRHEVRVTLLGRDGAPLSPGTTVRGSDGAVWPVGLDGHADLVGIAAGSVMVRTGDARNGCRYTLSVPATDAIVRLAAARCEP